jgi:hypothetical protein
MTGSITARVPALPATGLREALHRLTSGTASTTQMAAAVLTAPGAPRFTGSSCWFPDRAAGTAGGGSDTRPRRRVAPADSMTLIRSSSIGCPFSSRPPRLRKAGPRSTLRP